MREKTLREISVDTAILARLEDRLAVLDRMDERLKRIERLLIQWPLPECHSETGFNFQDYLGAQLKCPYIVGEAIVTVFMVDEKTGHLDSLSTLPIEMRSIHTHKFAGLRCGVRTDIELLNPEAFGVFDFWYFEGGGTVETTVSDKTVHTQRVPDADEPTRVTLRGYGQAIQKVTLLSANEMFLTSFCAGFDR